MSSAADSASNTTAATLGSATPCVSTGGAFRLRARHREMSSNRRGYIVAMPVTFAEVAKSEYILLTTFTKDGRPKPTAIWAAPVGDGWS